MNNKDNRTEKRKLGDIGENVACEFLVRHGFEIIERNYLRKWGEIDIVAKKSGKIHFVEVKSVSCEISRLNVSHGTSAKDNPLQETYRPEENLHPGKLKRLYRTIETYLLHPPERLVSSSRAGKKEYLDWQLDLITAKIDTRTRQARVEMLENII